MDTNSAWPSRSHAAALGTNSSTKPLAKSNSSADGEIEDLLRKHGGKVGAELPSLTLSEAADRGDLQGVKDFLDNGADVNAKDESGATPLDINHNKEIADLLRKHGGKYSKIRFAARDGDSEAVKEFLAAGADVNAKGMTPLHNAAMNGHTEVAKLLLANGADVNAKNKNGGTPLHRAASKGHNEIVELLIGKGADVNAKDDKGRTPLDEAVAEGHKEIVELLLAKSADVNTLIGGETPLDYAEGEIADLLRKHGGKTGEELKAVGK